MMQRPRSICRVEGQVLITLAVLGHFARGALAACHLGKFDRCNIDQCSHQVYNVSKFWFFLVGNKLSVGCVHFGRGFNGLKTFFSRGLS